MLRQLYNCAWSFACKKETQTPQYFSRISNWQLHFRNAVSVAECPTNPSTCLAVTAYQPAPGILLHRNVMSWVSVIISRRRLGFEMPFCARSHYCSPSVSELSLCHVCVMSVSLDSLSGSLCVLIRPFCCGQKTKRCRCAPADAAGCPKRWSTPRRAV